MKRLIFALLAAIPAITASARTNSDEQLTPILREVSIFDSIDAVNPNGTVEPGFQYKGPKFLPSNEVAQAIRPFLGKELTTNSLHTLERDLILLCRRHDHPVVDVIAPEQDFTTGWLQLAILEGKTGKVIIARKGGKWYSDKFIRNQIRLKQGDSIVESRLLEDINWLNQNPFRDVTVAFSQGAFGGQTDIHLEETDRFPLQGFAGYDNGGPKIIGEDRLSAGLLWGNAFGLDQRFNYSYMTDTAFDHLRLHTASYDIPLPWRNTLTFFGTYADVRAEGLPSALTEKGDDYQASMRYAIPLPRFGPYTHEVAFGFDYKHSDDNLLYGSVNPNLLLAATPADVLQFFGGYRALLIDGWGKSDFAAQAYYSPGNLTSENTRAAFSAAYPANTASEYYYLHLNADRSITNLPGKLSLLFRGQAQVTDCRLLPSEQMGFGGVETVRGYDERFVNADRGFVISSEIHAPPVVLGSRFWSPLADRLDCYAFCDYGYASLIEPQTGFDDYKLASAGVGLEYVVNRYVDLRADYGFQLIRNNSADFLMNQVPADHSSSRGDISVVVRF